LNSGDVIIVEDGVVDDLGLGTQLAGGPNLAVSEFLGLHGEDYEVLAEYCDFYGSNATYNPNGFLRRRL
jgi:cephalosporin hydroxylase